MNFKRPFKKQKEKTITEEIFTSSLVSYILSTLAYAIGPLVDGAVIGRLGVDAVASYGLIWPTVFVYSMIGAVFSGGLRNLYTDLLTKGESEKANTAFTATNIFCFIISVLFVIITIIFIDPIARLLGANGSNAHLMPLVKSYLYGYVIGIPFMNAARMFSSFMQLDADANRAVYSVIIMTVVDVIGDLIAVYAFPGSLLAIAIATSLGNLTYFVVLALHFLRKNRTLQFTLKDKKSIPHYITESFKLGAPTGIARLANTVAGIFINRFLSAYATSTMIAAYSVHRSMGTLVNATYLGVADTVWMLSSVFFGEEDKQSLDELQKLSIRIGLRITLIAGISLILFSPVLASLYIGKESTEAYTYALQAIRFYGYSTPLYLLVYVFEDYLYGIKKTMLSYIYTVLVECIVLVPVAYFMIRLWGGQGAWFATPVYLFILALLTYFYIQSQPYGKNFSMKRLLVQPDFGSDAGAELSIDANTMLEVVGLSRIAGLFCKENGLSDKQGFYLSLFIEEMAGNIIEHGFNDGKAHSISMRILAKENEVILRLRDNCRPFDPLQRYQMANDEDLSKNIGIRMVVKSCKEIHYISTFNTNNLIVKI